MDIIQEKFFGPANIRTLADALMRGAGAPADEKLYNKAAKIANHYVNEVWEHNGPEALPSLNKKVYNVGLASFRQILSAQGQGQISGQQQIMQRQAEQRVNQRVREAPVREAPVREAPVREAPVREIQSAAFQSVNERYTSLQDERNPPKEKRPPIPDFKISTESDKDGPSPAEMYELEMRRREDEAALIQVALERKKQAEGGNIQKPYPSIQNQGSKQKPITIGIGEESMSYVDALFDSGPAQVQAQAQAQVSAQAQAQEPAVPINPRKKTQQEEEELVSTMNNMDSLYRAMANAGQGMAVSNVNSAYNVNMGRTTSDPNMNPTLAQPSMVSSRPSQQMDTLIRQDPVVSYKEVEENLFLYSADRDWVNDDTQSRYNFTINFDPANNKQGFNKNLTVQQRFRNISRIELVKTILPIEGVETFFNVDGSGATGLYTNTSSRVSVYQFPYIVMRIPELDVNNYGTDDQLNNSFAVIQYDSEWYTDTFDVYNKYLATTGGVETGVGNLGYSVFIPKHLKCQKVFQPTPLATLQKLTVELQRPDGSTVSPYSDVIDISSVVYGDGAGSGAPGSSTFYATNIVDSAGSAYYIILKTKKYFNRWQYTVGDRILLGGLSKEQIGAPASEVAKYELLDFLQDPTGHTIVGVGFDTSAVTDGYNSFGYADWIAIRAPINDPTTGATTMRLIGGDAGAYADLGTALNATSFSKGRILNYSHQVQVVLRVISRVMDSTSRVRPDNL